jgi:hypothetical protein
MPRAVPLTVPILPQVPKYAPLPIRPSPGLKSGTEVQGMRVCVVGGAGAIV